MSASDSTPKKVAQIDFWGGENKDQETSLFFKAEDVSAVQTVLNADYTYDIYVFARGGFTFWVRNKSQSDAMEIRNQLIHFMQYGEESLYEH